MSTSSRTASFQKSRQIIIVPTSNANHFWYDPPTNHSSIRHKWFWGCHKPSVLVRWLWTLLLARCTDSVSLVFTALIEVGCPDRLKNLWNPHYIIYIYIFVYYIYMYYSYICCIFQGTHPIKGWIAELPNLRSLIWVTTCSHLQPGISIDPYCDWWLIPGDIHTPYIPGRILHRCHGCH